MTKIVEKSKIWFSISLVLIVIGLGFMITKGLNFGIDFKGGTKLVVEFGKEFDKPAVDEVVKSIVPDAVTKTVDDTQYEIKDRDLDESKASEVFTTLKETYELSDDSLVSQTQIGASVGKELTRNSIIALIVACAAMLAYIAIRFKFDYAVAAIIALIHDVLITLAVYAVFDIPVNTPFIAAILTIVGYSMNDTIVIFDRIRENSKSMRKATAAEIADKSIYQTLGRSIKTTVTTLIAIGAVNVFVPTIREFSLPLLVGITAGAYSSIFIASPIWVKLREGKFAKNKREKVA